MSLWNVLLTCPRLTAPRASACLSCSASRRSSSCRARSLSLSCCLSSISFTSTLRARRDKQIWKPVRRRDRERAPHVATSLRALLQGKQGSRQASTYINGPATRNNTVGIQQAQPAIVHYDRRAESPNDQRAESPEATYGFVRFCRERIE